MIDANGDGRPLQRAAAKTIQAQLEYRHRRQDANLQCVARIGGAARKAAAP